VLATATNATTINTTTLGNSTVSLNNASSSWVEGGNYVKFTVDIAEGQNLTVISRGETAVETRGFLNSIQIVAIPEPATIGMLLTGTLLIFGMRKFRK
jgi:hypothetical protein